jgi:hypothetical protein
LRPADPIRRDLEPTPEHRAQRLASESIILFTIGSALRGLRLSIILLSVYHRRIGRTDGCPTSETETACLS